MENVKLGNLLSLNLVTGTAIEEINDLFGVQNENIARVDTVNGTWYFCYSYPPTSFDLRDTWPVEQ